MLIEGEEVPSIDYYPAAERTSRMAMLIFAGGGYAYRTEREDVHYAEYFNKQGIDAFVVNYRVKPYRFPVELLDARRAVRFVRANAEKFDIDPTRVVVIGSSAGGHLAALVSTYRGEIDGEGVDEIDNVDPIPNAQVLCYPVLDIEGHVMSYSNLLGDKIKEYKAVTPRLLATGDTPMCFMWHCECDGAVTAMNTYRYALRLLELGVSHECHIYPRGTHGMGMLTDSRFKGHEYMLSWTTELMAWLRLNKFVD